MRSELVKRYLLLVVIGIGCVAADQATKVWARSALKSPERRYVDDDSDKKATITVIEDRLEFRLSFNRGSAFGMFNKTEGARWWLVVVGILALGLVVYLLHRPEGESTLFVVALSLVAGGAVGNLIDRILFGKVTDFVVVWLTEAFTWTWPWPAFNVADSVLVIGVGLMLVQIIYQAFHPEEEEERADQKEKPSKPKKQKKK
jgi:signal peptidase II